MNSINNYDTLGYNLCAAKDCNNKGIHRLKIQYIKRIGFFCDSCASQLLDLAIVTKEGNDENDLY